MTDPTAAPKEKRRPNSKTSFLFVPYYSTYMYPPLQKKKIVSQRLERMTALSRIVWHKMLPMSIILAMSSLILMEANATNEAGTRWLEKNREGPMKVETPSGLIYKRMNNLGMLHRKAKRGELAYHPAFDAYCKIEIEVSRVLDEDGTTEVVERSKLGEPLLTRPEDTIPAVQEALQSMVEGDWWELYVPSHLGYTNDHRLKGSVQGDEALFISLELKEIAHGDKLPFGQINNCFIAIDWDAANGNYFYQPNKDCDERDRNYIDKVSAWQDRSLKVEQAISRLRKLLKSGDHKQELGVWIRRRIHILKQFLREKMRICTLFYVDVPEQGRTLYRDDCNVQEQEYIVKVRDWDVQKVGDEIDRLQHMDQSSMDPALASWVRRRIRILNQIRSLRRETQTNDDASQPEGEVPQTTSETSQAQEESTQTIEPKTDTVPEASSQPDAETVQANGETSKLNSEADHQHEEL